MDINDYLKIANEYAVKHNKTDDFIVMGLYKLIQESSLPCSCFPCQKYISAGMFK